MSETPELIAALCKAQAAFKPALKDAVNPHFKKNYADLGAIWDACKDALAANDLFVSQQPQIEADGACILVTKVYHASGGCLESRMPIVVAKQNDPQAFGAAMTYTRRYSVAATLGIVTDDDDAESAMNREQGGKSQKQPKAETPPADMPPPPPVEGANSKQKEEIIMLLNHPMVLQEDKKKMLENLGKLSKGKADSVIANLKTKQEEWAQNAKAELHDLITENSEIIGDALVEDYFKILERGNIKEVVDTLDKVKYKLKQVPA